MKLHHHFDLEDRCPDCMVDQGERCHCRDAQLDRHGPSIALVMAVVALFWVAVAVGVRLALKGAS